MNLTELAGTISQVFWANTLRLEFISYMEKTIAEMTSVEYDDFWHYLKEDLEPYFIPQYENIKAELSKLLEFVLKETKASFWINNRYYKQSYYSISKLYAKYIDFDHSKDIIPEDIKIESTLSPK